MISTLMLSALMAVVPAGAEDFGNSIYGSAPPSLDYPSGYGGSTDEDLRKAAVQKKNDWLREELFFLSAIDPFPSQDVPLVDPITKKKVARTLVGPAFRARGYGANYDYYRYVTFFDIKERKEQLYQLPELHSKCGQKSDLWTNYGVTVSYSASVKAGISIEGIGLDASFTKSRGFNMGQYVAAENLDADYIPYAFKKDWYGSTHIQLLDSKTGKTKFLDKPTKASPWWVWVFFPFMTPKSAYPFPFEVKDASWKFEVLSENVKSCPAEFGVR